MPQTEKPLNPKIFSLSFPALRFDKKPLLTNSVTFIGTTKILTCLPEESGHFLLIPLEFP